MKIRLRARVFVVLVISVQICFAGCVPEKLPMNLHIPLQLNVSIPASVDGVAQTLRKKKFSQKVFVFFPDFNQVKLYSNEERGIVAIDDIRGKDLNSIYTVKIGNFIAYEVLRMLGENFSKIEIVSDNFLSTKKLSGNDLFIKVNIENLRLDLERISIFSDFFSEIKIRVQAYNAQEGLLVDKVLQGDHKSDVEGGKLLGAFIVIGMVAGAAHSLIIQSQINAQAANGIAAISNNNYTGFQQSLQTQMQLERDLLKANVDNMNFTSGIEKNNGSVSSQYKDAEKILFDANPSCKSQKVCDIYIAAGLNISTSVMKAVAQLPSIYQKINTN
ncbi:MAG: hypothetical protein H7839_14635 [Magnetococcus sp. YQC-5]